LLPGKKRERERRRERKSERERERERERENGLVSAVREKKEKRVCERVPI
jgi:hypothetical protein